MDALEHLGLPPDASHREYDVAAANLMAALDLPGAEGLKVAMALDWLDGAAKQVRVETQRHSWQFRDRPQDFEHSAPYFCMRV